MSLINSLGKHPASNTSCLDGEAMTSLGVPSQPFSLLRPSGTHLGQGQGMPSCGCVWLGQAEPGDYMPTSAALPQLALGLCCVLALLEGKVIVLAASPWGQSTLLLFASQMRASHAAAFPWEGYLLFHWCHVCQQQLC